MIIKIQDTSCVQKCVCGTLHKHEYSSLYIHQGFIQMPICADCGSLEILHNNNAEDEHGIMVSRVFAKVATQG